MAQVEQALYTVGVFQDASWAERGIDALKKQGFGTDLMTVLAKATPEATAFIERMLGSAPEQMELPVLGPTSARGTLIQTLNGAGKDLGRIGIAAAMRRAGFQPHDGLIYETLGLNFLIIAKIVLLFLTGTALRLLGWRDAAWAAFLGLLCAMVLAHQRMVVRPELV